jgi:lipopolysaccharide exporter
MTDDSKHDHLYKEVVKKAARGLGWNYLSYGLSKILNLITIAILAHLLTPQVFGIVGLASVAIDYLSIVNDLGLGAALIQRRHNVEEAANTAFTLNLVSGCVLTLITFVIAPLAAAFFHEPMVTPVLRLLGLTFFISAIGSIHNVRLQRELNFQRRLISDSGNSIIRSIVSIGLAISGFGVWSLVIGQLAGVSIAAILLWVIFPWRPRFTWDPIIVRELFKFGFPVMGTNALSGLEDNFDYVLIGRFFNATALGIYSLAYQLPESIVINVLWVISTVLFPAFSALQDHKSELIKSFLSVVKYVELIVLPICFGIIIAADPIIKVAFGEKWVTAIPILQVLGMYALVLSIGFHVGDVYKAIGRPDIQAKLSIAAFLIRVVALWIGAQYSLVGVAFGHLIAGTIVLVIRLLVAYKILGVTLNDIVHQLSAFIGGVGLALLALPTLYLTSNTSSLFHLLAVTLAGVIGYIGVIWFIERTLLIDAFQKLGLKVGKIQENAEA